MNAAASVPLFVAEHPAPYRVLTPLTVDCSVVAASLFLEPGLVETAGEIMGGCELHAPELLGYEFTNVAVKKFQQPHAAVGTEVLTSFEMLAIALHGVDFAAVLELAQRYSLSAYDASYLWLAAELKTSLATFDRRLAEAARRHLASLA